MLLPYFLETFYITADRSKYTVTDRAIMDMMDRKRSFPKRLSKVFSQEGAPRVKSVGQYW